MKIDDFSQWVRERQQDVERALERFALPGHDFIVRMFGGKPQQKPPHSD